MKFFIDTASLSQIREAQDLGVLDGVTTNPSLMAKEGISGPERVVQHYLDICAIVNGDVSAEVIATDYAGTRRSANSRPSEAMFWLAKPARRIRRSSKSASALALPEAHTIKLRALSSTLAAWSI